jgi:hypothetical protein
MGLYVDGRFVGSAAFPSFATSDTVGIDLGRRANNSHYFVGTLDEFAFYDKVLSGDQVRALFRAGH